MWAQNTPPVLSPGTAIPKVTCLANDKQSYALYLPSWFAANRKWPVIYVFDPAGRGAAAIEIIRTAAEKYGYIVVASNNSRNGPQGGSAEAAQAMWLDTQQRFPIDQARRYFAGMSGGARVATSLAFNCAGCVAGVIANAAGFPTNTSPTPEMKFAYFAAVGNADMNYPEFAELRPKLDALGIRYSIRVFEGTHGWAPPEVWNEALDWMDIEAMASGTLPRNQARIEHTMNEELSRAREFETKRDWLAALREYRAMARNFAGLADLALAKQRAAELEKSKGVAKQEKQEKEDIAQQSRLMSDLSAKLQGSGDLDSAGLMELRNAIAQLKRDAKSTSNQRDRLVRDRALGGLVIQAFESGQGSMEQKDYRAALAYFDLALAGSDNPGWAHYQRARAFAGIADKKQMLAELKQSLAANFHPPTGLDASEFARYLQEPEFQVLANEWKNGEEK